MKIQVPFNYNDELRKALNYYQERHWNGDSPRDEKLVL